MPIGGSSVAHRSRGSVLTVKAGQKSIIQFATDVFFCHDDDGVVEISVIRISSDVSAMESVSFVTENDTAMGGLHFEQTSSSILFAPGEYAQKVTIPIMLSPVWQPMLRFTVRLIATRGQRGYNPFSTCKVCVVHRSPFPTAVIEDCAHVISSDGAKALPPAELVASPAQASSSLLKARLVLYWEFARKCYAIAHVANMTRWQLFVDAFDNVVFLTQLVVSVYFVDHVLQPAGSVPLGQWARWQLALTCALLHASPTVLSKHLQERKSWFGIAGAARKSLQAEVLLKYLQMTERSRDQVGAAGFLAVLTRDAADVVDNGFMKLYVIAALFGKIACILLYTFFYAPRALIIQLLLLGFMLHRMYTHEATATTLRLKYFKALNQMLDLAADVANHYPLIRDSRLKPLTAQTLNRIIGNVNYLRNAITAHLTRAQLALPVASAWSVGAMMVVAPYAMDVLKMTPGTFLATLAATSSMGTQLQIFFAALSDMQLSIASLLQVFTFLNTPTESAVLMLESQKQQERGRKVAEDATLQVKARKKDAKWLTKLGMGGSPPAISQASRLTTACSQSSVQSCDVTSRSTFANVATTAFNRSRSTMSEHGGERVTTGSAHVLPPTPESAVSLADAPGAPGDSSEERTADDMLIELLDVHVSRDAESTESFKQASSSRPVPVAPALSVIHGTNMQIKQGRIYGVVGHGKAQMLRLLAKVVLPTSGEVFVPPHLAVQHLEHMPMFFKRLSLYENLLIRVPPEDWPPVEQVVNVCAMLGLSYPWLNFLRVSGAVHMGARARTSSAKPSTPAQMPQDAEVAARLSLPGEQDSEAADHFASTQPWALQLSNSEKQILQLAAALIADPNLLILHHPVKVFEASQATCVRSVLRSFVAERGMGNLLRGEQGVLARTVLFSCAASDHDSLELCDGIIVVGRPAGGATLFETSMLLEMGTAESDGTQLTTKGARLSHLVTGLLPKPSSAEAQIRRQTPPSLTPSEPSESASAQHRDSASLQSDRSPAQSHLLMV